MTDYEVVPLVESEISQNNFEAEIPISLVETNIKYYISYIPFLELQYFFPLLIFKACFAITEFSWQATGAMNRKLK